MDNTPWDKAGRNDPKFVRYMAKLGIGPAEYNKDDFPKWNVFSAYRHGLIYGGPRSSRTALLSLVQEVEGTEFHVYWQGQLILGDLQNKILEMREPRKIEKILQLFGVPDVPDGSGLEDLEFLNLRNESETTFKNHHLQEFFFGNPDAEALDLSTATMNGPFFKPATAVDDGYNVIVSAKTAKPDGTSKVAPMDLEIKSDFHSKDSDNLAKIDYEVLKQAVERVSMRMDNQGFLRVAYAFAVTGRSAWFLNVKRRHPTEKPLLWVYRVQHSDGGDLWMRITRLAKQYPHFFLSGDGAAIDTAMKKIGVTTWCCRVKALAQSQSVVYGVTVPKLYKSSGENLVGFDVTPSAITYAVKIVCEGSSFKKESEALEKIAAKAGAGSDFYALGAVAGDGTVTRFATNDNWETGIQYPSTGQFWWDSERKPVQGGAIIMKTGIATASQFPADVL